MYRATITTADGTTTETYPEPTAELMISSALRHDFTLTADPAAASLTLTGNGRTITLAPVEPLAPLTPAQRRALLALADTRTRITWERSRRNVAHLEHAGHALSHQVSMSLSSAEYVTGIGYPGSPSQLTLRAWLAVARDRRDPTTAASLLRAAFSRTPATT
jgi:hypothetical protein